MTGNEEGPLPRGRHGIDRRDIRANQRARIIKSTIECVASQGFVNTTVGHIVSRARVSRETFYELFADKEDCYNASLIASAGDTFTAFEAATGDRSQPALDRLTAGLTAYFESLAADPLVARCFVLERPLARARTSDEERVLDQTVDLIIAQFGFTDRFVVEAYLAMVNRMIEEWVRADRTEELPTMIPQLMPVVARVLDL